MTAHRLLMHAPKKVLSALPAETLLWSADGQPSSVKTTFGPDFAGIGPVPPLAVDFARLAALVFWADRTVERPRGFQRQLDLQLPVSDPDRWGQHADQLAGLFSLLSGDDWHLTFTEADEPPDDGDRHKPAEPPEGDVTVLFSGGADSTCGVLVAHGRDFTPVLASHFDWGNVRGQQRKALTALVNALGIDRPAEVVWEFTPQRQQAGSGVALGREASRRSRSALFVALGVAVAETIGKTNVWVAENGFTSLNLPLTPERRGALSTRTTHPTFLRGIAEVLAAVGIGAKIINPFEGLTKGELFAKVRDQIGADAAGKVLSATNSCAKPQQGVRGIAADASCGVCIGCLVRRAAFIAADIPDSTEYVEEKLSGAQRKRWMSEERRSVYEDVQYRLAIGFDEDDILDLGLPDDTDLDSALRIARAGLSELAAVKVS